MLLSTGAKSILPASLLGANDSVGTCTRAFQAQHMHGFGTHFLKAKETSLRWELTLGADAWDLWKDYLLAELKSVLLEDRRSNLL